jgi:hypothetical protein
VWRYSFASRASTYLKAPKTTLQRCFCNKNVTLSK